MLETAQHHATACIKLLDENRLADALEYCKNQGIDPPQCSLTAQSGNADRLRNIAMNMLADPRWWTRRLNSQAARDEAMAQIRTRIRESTSA